MEGAIGIRFYSPIKENTLKMAAEGFQEGDLLYCDSISHPNLYCHVAFYHDGYIVEFNSDIPPGNTLSSLIKAKKSAKIRIHETLDHFLATGYNILAIQRYANEYLAPKDMIEIRIQYYLFHTPKYNMKSSNCELVAKDIVLYNSSEAKEIEGTYYDQATMYFSKFHIHKHKMKAAISSMLTYPDFTFYGSYGDFMNTRNLYMYGLRETLKMSKMEEDVVIT